MEQSCITKKEVRRNIRGVGLSSLIYAAITFLFVEILYHLKYVFFTEMDTNAYIDMLNSSGVPMIILVSIGILFFFLFFHKRGIHKEIFVTENKMSFRNLGRTLALYSIVTFTGGLLAKIVEFLFSLVGYTTMDISPVATGQVTTFSMILYACLIGPIAEELIWRGFLLRTLQRYGKTTAIVITSLLFGLMHGNIPQAISAVFFGLLLSAVATNFSIKWSIALHIVHNVYVCVMQMFMAKESLIPTMLVGYAITAGIVFGIITLIRKRKTILGWLRSNLCEKPQMRWILFSVWTILIVAYYIFEIVRTVSKI